MAKVRCNNNNVFGDTISVVDVRCVVQSAVDNGVNTTDIIARLIDALVDNGSLNVDDLRDLVYPQQQEGFELVEDDTEE